MTIGIKTLVLNKNYLPISLFPLSTISAEDAITRVINGTCGVVFNYDRQIKTPTADLKWPSVIVRKDGSKIEGMVKLRRESLFYRDHGICAYCDTELTMNTLTYDHVTPQSRGGNFSWENIVCSCEKCNLEKGNSAPVGRWAPKRPAYKPTYWQLLNVRKKFPLVVGDINWMNFIGDWGAEIIVKS